MITSSENAIAFRLKTDDKKWQTYRLFDKDRLFLLRDPSADRWGPCIDSYFGHRHKTPLDLPWYWMLALRDPNNIRL